MRLPRPIKNSLLPLLLLLAAQKVCAQLAPADDFFNSGAQLYISNNIPAAKQSVETGLKFYPDDEKLKKLEELLKQQQQSQSSQSQQNQQQQNQQPSQQPQSKNDQPSPAKPEPQNSQAPPKPEEQKQDQSGQKKDESQKKSEPQKSAAEKKDGAKPDQPDAEGQPIAPGQMTPAEAKRLLDAQKGNEQLLTLQPKGKTENNQRPVKDW